MTITITKRLLPFTTIRQWLLMVTLLVCSATALAIEVGDTLVIDKLVTIDGQTLDRDALEDKHLVVQVWATWCPYCHRQNLNLIELAKRTEGMPLKIIALSVDRDPNDVRDYAKDHGINFTMAMMTPALDEAIGKRKGVPELYVVDPNGTVVQKDWGQMVDLDVFDLADYAQ